MSSPKLRLNTGKIYYVIAVYSLGNPREMQFIKGLVQVMDIGYKKYFENKSRRLDNKSYILVYIM